MGQELDQRKTDTIFDFLYVDHHRIGPFLSQFSEFRHLTDVVHPRSATDDAAVTGGLKGILSGETKSGEREDIERRHSLPGDPKTNVADIGCTCGGGDNIYGSQAIAFWQELGLIFGRPSDCYGTTPIAIMHEVKA
ncbi:hypothetical protein ACWGS9_34985 [Bradyrhizobium sp. Arg314]